ncbi:hypothetical protein KIW84_035966 [Lathyrus oleraceus]|uniref:Uncharacterized protein n=1 Tax=Pisum sativum TaxID=3888 RepID=A0A9D4Y3C8_PEA|nr:hypothetical protein KIW84_035966 [Pisum sativum]
MTITLDDVFNLFHLPLAGNISPFIANKGNRFHLFWQHDIYKNLVEQSMYDAVARVYMLHIVGYTILENKSHVYIDARCISMFVDFTHLEWARGYVSLTILYTSL